MKLRYTLKVVWLLFVNWSLKTGALLMLSLSWENKHTVTGKPCYHSLTTHVAFRSCFGCLIMERHKENPTTKQPNPTSVPRFLSFITRGARPVNAHSETPNPPAESEQTTMQKAPRLWISSHPVPLLPGPDKASWSGGTAMALPESTEMEETEFLTRQQETQWREETLIWRGRERMRQEQIVRGLSSFSKSWEGKWTL